MTGAAAYDVYRQPAVRRRLRQGERGAGRRRRRSRISGLANARRYYIVVRARDAAGNASDPSNEVIGLPHLTIGWANLQWPPTLTHTIRAIDRTDNVYGQVWIDGVTSQPGATPGLLAQLGFGPDGSHPAGNACLDLGRRRLQHGRRQQRRVRRVASARPDRHLRLRLPLHHDRRPGLDLRRPRRHRQRLHARPGRLADRRSEQRHDVTGDADRPHGSIGARRPASSSPGTRSPATRPYMATRFAGARPAGGPYTHDRHDFGHHLHRHGRRPRARPTTTSSARSTRRSTARGPLPEVPATAELRTVTLVFNVTVPATTDATGRSVYIAGFLDRLDGGLPEWDPAGCG